MTTARNEQAEVAGVGGFGFVMTPRTLRLLGTALEFYRRELVKNGHPVTEEVTALARHFIALGSGREVIEGHGGSLFAPLAPVPDGGGMDDQLLTRPAAAQRLGVSVSTLKRREAAGDIQPLRHGRVVRYRAADLIALMEAGH